MGIATSLGSLAIGAFDEDEAASHKHTPTNTPNLSHSRSLSFSTQTHTHTRDTEASRNSRRPAEADSSVAQPAQSSKPARDPGRNLPFKASTSLEASSSELHCQKDNARAGALQRLARPHHLHVQHIKSQPCHSFSHSTSRDTKHHISHENPIASHGSHLSRETEVLV